MITSYYEKYYGVIMITSYYETVATDLWTGLDLQTGPVDQAINGMNLWSVPMRAWATLKNVHGAGKFLFMHAGP